MSSTKQKPKPLWKRLLLSLVALFVLNASANFSEVHESYCSEHQYDEVESLFELVTEHLLDLDTPVPEGEDTEDDGKYKSMKEWVSISPATIHLPSIHSVSYFVHSLDRIYDFWLGEVFSPPDLLT